MWARKRILIWGKTRPELSRAYHETVCTGGILEDTRRLVRLYPIPLRYLEDDKVFRKYQWIEAHVMKSTRDVRPESYKIRLDTIVPGEHIPPESGNWGRRAEWVMAPGNVFASVEALQAARAADGTSIGLVKPKECMGFYAEAFPQAEKDEFWRKYRSIQRQPDLPFEPDSDEEVRPLPPPDFRFKIQFRCDDSACSKVHDFTAFDWEVDALYNSCRNRGDSPEAARDKVIAKLRDEACGPTKDTHFFLGNIATHPHIFTIVGLWYPKNQGHRQRGLFD
jgi:hypothetical protein